MEKISYQYLIAEIGFTPEQIREIVHEAQINFGHSKLYSLNFLPYLQLSVILPTSFGKLGIFIIFSVEDLTKLKLKLNQRL